MQRTQAVGRAADRRHRRASSLVVVICHDDRVIDHELSAAIVTYIWGDHSQPWPSTRPELLTERQLAYLPKIKSILATAFANDPPTERTLVEMGDRVEAAVRSGHPGLNDEAIQAVGDHYTYCWK